MLAVLALILATAAVLLTARAVALPRLKAARNLREIDVYGYNAEIPELPAETAPQEGPLGNLAHRVGAPLAGRLGRSRLEELQGHVRAAGFYELRPETFVGYRLLAAAALVLFVLWCAAGGAWSPVLVVGGVGYAGAVGWMAPLILVKGRGRRRLDEIDRQLADLIELLVVTVEAGLGFVASLRLATARMSGALGDELKLMLQEQTLGLDSGEALANLLERADTPSMRSFVRTVDQGQRLGVSVGQMMRGLAGEMRRRRRQAVEERAQRAPVKILFPLIFCIFPALLLVALYPAVHELAGAFGG